MAIVERRFAARIRALREPFYLVCGYGETGAELVKALTDRGQHAVVIDIRDERTSIIQLQNLREPVPSMTADARRPQHLLAAGLEHPSCAGVVALTDDNATNLKIAITAKLLHPDIRVICRADSHDIEANMASFGTDFIIDPFDAFATHLATALQSPCLYLLMQWLTGVEDAALSEPVYPPAKGRWIICGYGRFGKAIYQRLKQEGIDPVVIEAMPEQTGEPPEGCVIGRGTEASTLLEANVESAVGLVAGTDNDTNNLSIVMTARDLNPKLFVIARQNHTDNQRIINAVRADMVMHPSNIIADRIRVLLGTPLLFEFVHLAMYQEDAWSCQLVSRISALVHSRVPNICECVINMGHAPAVCNELSSGGVVTLGSLIRDPWDRERELDGIFLLLEREQSRKLLPDVETRLQEGDRLLVCGSAAAFTRMNWSLKNDHTLAYVRTGEDRHVSWLWRKFG
jgi:Trk K+ transport system NAD-binding subunit